MFLDIWEEYCLCIGQECERVNVEGQVCGNLEIICLQVDNELYCMFRSESNVVV